MSHGIAHPLRALEHVVTVEGGVFGDVLGGGGGELGVLAILNLHGEDGGVVRFIGHIAVFIRLSAPLHLGDLDLAADPLHLL